MTLSLPPFLMTSEEGSFARQTIAERKPSIIDRIVSLNGYSTEIHDELQAFKDEIANGIIQPLPQGCMDRTIWMEDLAPWQGKTWFEVPWLVAEAFFYRRLLEIVGYFRPGPWFGKDPFESLKEPELIKGREVFSGVYESIPESVDLKSFQEVSYKVLWGNRGDLSSLIQYAPDMDSQSDMVVLDHTREAFEFLSESPMKIAYFFDNAGMELYFDLAFIDYLLGHDLASEITCYLKNQPFFVSDAMPDDLERTIDCLMDSPSEKCQRLARQFLNAERSKLIKIETPPFLTHARDYRQMPDELHQQVSAHDLVIFKGDLNFRRLMGDRHWPPTTPVSAAAGYFPTSFLSFRTLKSEIILDLPEDVLADLDAHAENDWCTNGKRGTIIFHGHQHHE